VTWRGRSNPLRSKAPKRHSLIEACPGRPAGTVPSGRLQRTLRIFALLLSLALQASGQGDPDLHIDHFDAPSPPRPYRSYYGETVKAWNGYGVYFVEAEVNLRYVPLAATKKALAISYHLPPHFHWGNWLSVRRELGQLLDLRKYEGLALSVRTQTAENSRFRITLTDVRTSSDAKKHGADEMWWFDAPAGFLDPGVGTQTLYAPFRDFYLNFGEGARWNDGKLDLSRIVAFEINLVSDAGREGRGTVMVDCLRAYRKKKEGS
jgi:hypothetical protein